LTRSSLAFSLNFAGSDCADVPGAPDSAGAAAAGDGSFDAAGARVGLLDNPNAAGDVNEKVVPAEAGGALNNLFAGSALLSLFLAEPDWKAKGEAAADDKPPARRDEKAGGGHVKGDAAAGEVPMRLDEEAGGAKAKGDAAEPVVLAKLKVGLLSPVPHGADAAAGAAADEAENNETGCVNENGDAAVQGVLAKLKVELTPPVPKGVDEAADAAATVEVAAGSAAACEVATVVVIGVLVGSLLPHNSLTTLKNRCFSSAAAFAAFSSASFSAVRPLLVVSERSVPASRSSSTQSSHALAAAIMRGVSPRSFWQFTSAFAASRSRMQAGRPSLASQCSAVLRKSALQYRTFAPLRRAS